MLPQNLIFTEYKPGQFLAGADEVGRGCLAGPVVGGAVVFRSLNGIEKFRDSKTLSESRREELFKTIQQDHFWAVGFASVEEIDELNILWASQLAIVRALEKLRLQLEKLDLVYVDGHLKLREWKHSPQQAVIKGDQKIKLISAASIVAKVVRDRMMIEMDKAFPAYGFAANKGYGVEVHRKALQEYGATIHHRRSFKGV